MLLRTRLKQEAVGEAAKIMGQNIRVMGMEEYERRYFPQTKRIDFRRGRTRL